MALIRFEDLRARDRQDLDRDFFNRRFRLIAEAIASLQAASDEAAAVSDNIVTLGLTRINEILTPALVRVQSAAELGFLTAASSTSLTLTVGQDYVFELVDTPAADLFTPTPFLTIMRSAVGAYEDWAVAQLLDYDAETRGLHVEILAVNGNVGASAYNDWVIAASAGIVPALADMLAQAAANITTAQGILADVQAAADLIVDGPVSSVNGKTGAVSLVMGDIPNLVTTLGGKADSLHTHTIANITNLQTTLDAKMDLTGGTFTGKVTYVTSSTGGASINIPHGVAPTSPANGDIWTTTSGLIVRINGSTKTVATTDAVPTLTGTGATGTWNISISGSAASATTAGTASAISDGAVATTAKISDGVVTPAKLNDAAALSVLARSANTSGVRADVTAGANGTVFSRLANALGFNTLTALLDDVFGNTQGKFLRRGATGWEAADVTSGGMTLLGTLTAAGGTTLSLTGIATDYKEIVVVVDGVTCSVNPRSLTMALSVNNGGAYGQAQQVGMSINATRYGTIRLARPDAVTTARSAFWNESDNSTDSSGFRLLESGSGAGITADQSGYLGIGHARLASTSGAVNAIRFAWNGSGVFNSGSIHVYGVK